jgi:mannose/fructose/N-acetylgalactosamine-specific phosphotransferase system component IID
MIYDDASAQKLQRLTRTAICLGILTVLGGVAISYIAYRTNWNTAPSSSQWNSYH